MSRPRSYRDLVVWKKAMALARRVYSLTEELPKKETYGLIAQARRAAVSVPSNIAEGHGRLTDLQFRHFLGNARGSLYEMQTQLELAANLGLLDVESVREVMQDGSEVVRLINGLITSLRAGQRGGANSAHSANSASSALKEIR